METRLESLELFRRKLINDQDYIPGGQSQFKAEADQEIIIKCSLEEMVRQFFKDFVVVWHAPDINSQELQNHIAQIEKLCEIKVFTEWEKAVEYVKETKADCHVVTSEIIGEEFLKQIASNRNVSEIFIFCENKESYPAWAKTHEKAKFIENIIFEIKESLTKYYKKPSSLTTTLPAFAPIFNDGDKTEMNHLHRYLKVVPHFKSHQQAKTDFVNLSRSIYPDEKNKVWIDKFENEYNAYNKKEILSWYTQESFLYKVTNNCLRIATADSIQYCRLLLRDIGKAIKEHYSRESYRFGGLLYRGAYLSQEEWGSLKANLNKEIEMHGFLSVSKAKTVALHFVEDDPTQKVFITIIVPHKGTFSSGYEQGFAEVHGFSEYPQEKEILFNVRSRFTILETEEEYSEDLKCRHLVLFYGAQGFRQFHSKRTSKGTLDLKIPREISCALCHISPTEMFYLSLPDWGDKQYICKKCLPTFLEKSYIPLLCIRPKIPIPIWLRGFTVTYPPKEEIPQLPLYGYRCHKCQAKNQSFYYKCADCSNGKQAFCENCLENLSGCLMKRHGVVLENCPFSFWCEKMTKSEEYHSDFQETSKLDGELRQAEMYFESHQHEKAIEYYSLYIQQTEKKKPINATSLIEAYDRMGEIHRGQGDYSKALEYFTKGLQLTELYYGENIDLLIGAYNSLGLVYSDLGEYQKALDCFEKYLEPVILTVGENHLKIATCYNNIAGVYQSQKEYSQALEYYFKAIKIVRILQGDSHPQVATYYNNVGVVYDSQKDYAKAREYYKKCLEIYKPIYGENDFRLAIVYSNLGALDNNQGEYDKALKYHLKSMEIYNFVHGKDHPRGVINSINLGLVYKNQGEFEKALEYYSRGLEIAKKVYGDCHHLVSLCCVRMGEVFKAQKENNKAIEYLSQALEINKSLYGDDHLRAIHDQIEQLISEENHMETKN